MTEERKTYKVSTPVGKMTITEIVQWCEGQGLDPSTTTFSSGHIVHQHTETDDEYARRLDLYRQADARQREWVKKRYHELFGDQHERLIVKAEALEEVARWSEQPDIPTEVHGQVSAFDLFMRAVSLRAQADVLELTEENQ